MTMKHALLVNMLLIIVVMVVAYVAVGATQASPLNQTEYIHTLERIDSLSRVVLENNDVFDMDGSDDAAALLEEYVKLDDMKK